MRKSVCSLMVLLLSTMATGPVAGDPIQSWLLWAVKPSQLGVLESCALLKKEPPPLLGSTPDSSLNPLRLQQGLTIHWQGGDLVQAEREATQKPTAIDRWNPFDSCFILTVAESVVAAGAIVPRASARLLKFDTLVLRQDARQGEAFDFDLLPAFPGDIMQRVPEAWWPALTPISRRPGPQGR